MLIFEKKRDILVIGCRPLAFDIFFVFSIKVQGSSFKVR